MNKTLLAVAAALAIATPSLAQDLPAPQCDVLKQLGAKFGALNKGSDEERRQFALFTAEQFAFSFPGEGWGSKSADASRPQTKDVVARNRNGVLEGWDLVDGSSRAVICNSHVALPGQHFIAVAAVDHLGVPPPPPPPPTSDVDARLQAIEARLAKLEAGGSSSGTGDTTEQLAVIKEQLAVTKQILELLKKTAAKFGVQ